MNIPKGTPLQEWFNDNPVDDEMIWKSAYKQQFMFVRDKLNGLMQNSLEPDERNEVKVISKHTSKSILLPVYHLQRGELHIILRENFYNWKMTVINPNLVLANFDGLFHTTPPLEPDYTGDELADVYFEGFPKDLIFGYYDEPKTDKSHFSAHIINDQMMWTTLYLILKDQGYVTPAEWNTRKNDQKELKERNAKREEKKQKEQETKESDLDENF